MENKGSEQMKLILTGFVLKQDLNISLQLVCIICFSIIE